MRNYYTELAIKERERQESHEYDRHIQRAYGITLKEYNCMLEEQGGGCAICGKTPAKEGRRLAVDHSHITGKVRGILCGTCNIKLGMIEYELDLALGSKKFVDFIGGAIDYLKRYE